MLLALIVLLPLAGYLLLTFAGKYLPRNSGGIVASLLVAISFLLSMVAFFMTRQHGMLCNGAIYLDRYG